MHGWNILEGDISWPTPINIFNYRYSNSLPVFQCLALFFLLDIAIGSALSVTKLFVLSFFPFDMKEAQS